MLNNKQMLRISLEIIEKATDDIKIREIAQRMLDDDEFFMANCIILSRLLMMFPNLFQTVSEQTKEQMALHAYLENAKPASDKVS